MKKTWISWAAVALTGFTGLAHSQTVLTVSSWVPPTHGLSMSQKEWCDDLATKTSNRVRCNILPRAVTPAPGTYDAVRNGLVDVSFTVHGYTPGRFVLSQMAEFPFLGDRAEPLSVAFHRVASKYPEFTAEHQGVKVLGFFTHGPGIVFNTKKPITRVEDLSGLKFRVGGGMVNEISKTLDMNVTLKPAPDSYELLSSGVMDGTLFPAESTDSFKIDKIIKHATQFPGGLYNTSFVFMMNPAKYNSLSADYKKVDRVDDQALSNMQKNGVKVIKADNSFVSGVTVRINKLERDWAQAAKAKGLKDPAGTLAEFRAEIAKLQKQK
jgi:TRAP-type C4-dicarboxylate transport system substrate-binding protein